ncbi:MAG: AAA family ATPase [Candidatus Lokiarchaeota archaeon]|nr:AAA family ATPase [Candidatus Lokiarchaeota archaeon]
MCPKLILFGGKGGVGKSTTSAATAVHLAKLAPEKRILLISFDMAHNLGDLFEIPLSRGGFNLFEIRERVE